ncbi:Aste57867_16814 [Aphanomyces stellatus]|uniref:Aste57867_16814 protein n=1 Tax=Aphanomyces stellatus TaxID=120398 RepID=A0A485L6A0_9STRA|nr:hypothetical protein As57867_016756 [Aphanomyces stellatus]VFT93579.1 Aste57867_16814 [Aphanomyces stellatus]
MMTLQVPFLVTLATSEDDAHPAMQLQVHAESSQGWQSTKLCEYPQEVVLMVNHGNPIHVAKCQLLIHHTKIPTRVDVFVKDHAATPHFRKLGFVVLDPNDSTHFNARELKTITIDATVAYLKLALLGCHKNKFNVFDQVGLVAVTLYGLQAATSPHKKQMDVTLNPLREAASHPPHHPSPPPNQSPAASSMTPRDNAFLDTFYVPHPTQPGTRLSLAQIVESLRIQRGRHVDFEDYVAAKVVKANEDRVVTLGRQLMQLQRQKGEVVRAEKFDAATLLKEEMDTLLGQVASIVDTIATPAIGEIGGGSPKLQRLRLSPTKSKANPPKQLAQDAPTEPEPLEPAMCEKAIPLFSDRLLERAYSQHVTLREPGVVDLVQALRVLPTEAKVLDALLHWLHAGILQLAFHVHILDRVCADPSFVRKVFATTSTVLVATVAKFKPFPQLKHDLPPIVTILINRLGDSSSKLRNKTGVTLLELANKDLMGPRYILDALLAIQRTAGPVHWRMTYGLLRICTSLFGAYECPLDTPDITTMVSFAAAQNGFDHPVTQVCEATTQFVVALYHLLGNGADVHLACLTPLQKTQYKHILADEWHEVLSP